MNINLYKKSSFTSLTFVSKSEHLGRNSTNTHHGGRAERRRKKGCRCRPSSDVTIRRPRRRRWEERVTTRRCYHPVTAWEEEEGLPLGGVTIKRLRGQEER